MWNNFSPACIKTLWQKLLNVHWRSIPTTAPRPVKSLWNWTKLPEQCGHSRWRPIVHTKKRNHNRWYPLSLIGQHCCALHPTADWGCANEAELFRRFDDDVIWISASEISHGRIRQALTSGFPNSGFKLTFRQSCTAEKTGEAEFLDVSHCVTFDDDFGFVTKDFLKPPAEESNS